MFSRFIWFVIDVENKETMPELNYFTSKINKFHVSKESSHKLLSHKKFTSCN